MTGYLLDTNVISELTRDVPEPKVLAFLTGRDDVWLSSILIHEVDYGVRLLPRGERRSRLSRVQASLIATYGHRILTLDRAGAECAAEFRARAWRSGHPVDLVDLLIAGMAKANALAVATRNVSDFRPLDIEVVNPWDAPRPE